MAYVRISISECSMGSRIRETFNVPERNEERFPMVNVVDHRVIGYYIHRSD